MNFRHPLLLATVALSFTSFSHAETGTFTTLSYNVAGLLELFSSADTDRQQAIEQISCYVNGFDVVNVQEDFNYHAALYDTCNTHTYRTSTTGGMGIGSGLNTLSYYAFPTVYRVSWDACNGVDCLTPKGFTLTQVQLSEGVYVDVYNLHTQAQVADADLSARRANVLQLVDYINQHSSDNAVIIAGDTNTRFTREGDNIRALLDIGFSDVWVDLVRQGSIPPSGAEALVCDPKITDFNCEIVDKVLYRSNAFIDLTPTDYQVRVDDVNSDGEKLSDHPPVAANWQYSTNENMQLSAYSGGHGGTFFSDVTAVDANPGVASVWLRAAARVDQIGLVDASGNSRGYGGTGGNLQALTLQTGEYISAVEVCLGDRNNSQRVFYTAIETNQQRVISGGTVTGNCIDYQAPNGWQISGLHGRAGDELDALGVIYTPVE
ncbi:jacalin-like lectin [Alteromonas gilva]|uniref:Jacalin-like lectin n=1 Tax=Alteromonas gilva TaxID=2987522 RepID=A0ABT5L4E7_9ALTE|nr:jacalin-like lectin [Alteromonas gilva]MDC8831910.1 jacalin-like lectin [Alteromonas gilva]